MVTDEDGLLAARMLHLPYGEIDQAHSTGKERTTTKFASFTGQELDSAIGLLYYKSRYYDPSIGRFMSPDTVLPGKGMEPQGLNRYAYVFNNPIKYVDPTGHAPKLGLYEWLQDPSVNEWDNWNFKKPGRLFEGWIYPNRAYLQNEYAKYEAEWEKNNNATANAKLIPTPPYKKSMASNWSLKPPKSLDLLKLGSSLLAAVEGVVAGVAAFAVGIVGGMTVYEAVGYAVIKGLNHAEKRYLHYAGLEGTYETSTSYMNTAADDYAQIRMLPNKLKKWF